MYKKTKTNFISVSRILNEFFPFVDIQSLAVQKGIARGRYLDSSIENWFFKKAELHPDVHYLGISVENITKVNFNVLEAQCQQCWKSFQNFITENKCSILEVQKTVAIPEQQVHGIVDALIKFNHQKYIIDWKSKEKFKDYSSINYEDDYGEYIDWCNTANTRAKPYYIFLQERTALYAKYNLGNFRYLLQVTFYWYLLGCPKDYELLIGYFTATGEYLIYSFAREKALKIAQSLLKHVNSDQKIKDYFRDKIIKFDWTTLLQWKRVY